MTIARVQLRGYALAKEYVYTCVGMWHCQWLWCYSCILGHDDAGSEGGGGGGGGGAPGF